jgi:hypothetical protein
MSAMIGTTWVWKLSILFSIQAFCRHSSPARGPRRARGTGRRAPGIGLAQERVKLFDQARHGGLLVHGLVRQRTELAAQCRDHPAGEVQIALVRVAEVLLDRDQLLLTDKAVPAAQGLGVLTVSASYSAMSAHDRRRVAGDIQTGLEAVLQRMRAAYSGLISSSAV